jgi:hypothetical protein
MTNPTNRLSDHQSSTHKPLPNPLGALMSALGHSETCIARSRHGHAASSGSACGCNTRSVDDPAVAVALALQFAKQRKRTGIPIPPPVVRLLAARVSQGDGACLAVAQSLRRQGLLTSPGGISDALLAHDREPRSVNAEGMQ